MHTDQIHGIDVSKYQDPRRFDWGAITERAQAAAPERPFFVLARATYGGKGVNTYDPQFRQFAEKTRKSGARFGAYLFARQLHTAAEHLAAFRQQLASIDGLRPGDFVPMLDIENNAINGDGAPSPAIINTVFHDIAKALSDEYGGLILYRAAYFTDYLRAANNDQWLWMLNFNYHHHLADYSVPRGQPRIPEYIQKRSKELHGASDTDARYQWWHIHQSKPSKVPFYKSQNDEDVIDVNTYNPIGTWSPPIIAEKPAVAIIPGEPTRQDEGEEYDNAFELVHAACVELARGAARLEAATDVLRNIR
jgi:hypothetical protein